jgi:hypothetical protein
MIFILASLLGNEYVMTLAEARLVALSNPIQARANALRDIDIPII